LLKVPIFRKGSLAFLSESRFVLKIVNQAGLYACVLRESSVPTEPALGHLRCRVTDMPPQPNSPSGRCLETRLATNSPEGKTLGAVFATVGSSRCRKPRSLRRGQKEDVNPPCPLVKVGLPPDNSKPRRCRARRPYKNHWSLHSISEATFQVVVFHFCFRCHLYYIPDVAAQSQTGVKLNRVFFPRLALQVRSLDCRFAR